MKQFFGLIDAVIPTGVADRPLRLDEKNISGKIGFGIQQQNVERIIFSSSARWCSIYSSSCLYIVRRFVESFFRIDAAVPISGVWGQVIPFS